MHSPSTVRSDQCSVAPEAPQFGRRGSLAAFHQPCCELFVADDERSTRARGEHADNASLATSSL